MPLPMVAPAPQDNHWASVRSRPFQRTKEKDVNYQTSEKSPLQIQRLCGRAPNAPLCVCDSDKMTSG
eukprot:2330515-Amphidinium_carterae.1